MSLEIYGFDFLSLKGAYFLSVFFIFIWLYSYIIYLYRAQAKGKVDYEKYGKLALNDSLNDEVIESCKDTENKGDNDGLAK